MTSLRMRAVLVVALVLATGGCSFNGIYSLPLPGDTVSKEDGFVVRADFADALNVVPRSTVRVGDVPVGQVESVTRVGWHARVTMRIRKDVVLPDDANAEIRQTSLLGEKYVALSKPESTSDATPVASTGRLGANDVIPLDRTGRNPEVEEVLGALSFLLSGGGVGQLQTITHELNDMMDGRTGKIRDAIGQLNTLVGTLDSQRGDIIDTLESLNGLSKTLVTEKDTIGDAIDAVGPAVTVLRDQETQLVKALSELKGLGEVGTRVVNEIKDDLLAELDHLQPVLRELSDTGDSLVPGLVAAASYPFPIEAADAIKGDYANVVFKLQIKLTPVSEGGLLPTKLDDLVTLCRGTPLAPICAPAGDAVDQLCSLLGSLPLCADSKVDDVSATLERVEQGLNGANGSSDPGTPTPGGSSPQPSASPGTGAGGADGSLIQRFFGGILGGLVGGVMSGGSP